MPTPSLSINILSLPYRYCQYLHSRLVSRTAAEVFHYSRSVRIEGTSWNSRRATVNSSNLKHIQNLARLTRQNALHVHSASQSKKWYRSTLWSYCREKRNAKHGYKEGFTEHNDAFRGCLPCNKDVLPFNGELNKEDFRPTFLEKNQAFSTDKNAMPRATMVNDILSPANLQTNMNTVTRRKSGKGHASVPRKAKKVLIWETRRRTEHGWTQPWRWSFV